MTLLKEDGTTPPKPIPASKVYLVWPHARLPSDILLRIGFWICLGGGIALTVVLPLLLMILGCIIIFALMIFGGSLGALL